MQVRDVLGETVRQLQRHIPHLAMALIAPALIAIVAVRIGMIGGQGGVLSFMGQIVKWGLLAAFYVTVHRAVLFSEAPPRPLGFQIGPREFRYIGYFIMITIWPAIAGLILFYGGVIIAGLFGTQVEADPMSGTISPVFLLLAIPGLVLAVYIASRLSPIMPAVAADHPGKLMQVAREVWELAHGSVLTIFLSGIFLGIVFLIPVMILSMIIGLLVQMTGWIILDVAFITLADFAGVTLQAVMLSVVYRMLTAPGGGTGGTNVTRH